LLKISSISEAGIPTNIFLQVLNYEPNILAPDENIRAPGVSVENWKSWETPSLLIIMAGRTTIFHLNQLVLKVLMQPFPPEKKSTSEFHLLPKLPIELRQKIWRLTVRPRIIPVLQIPRDPVSNLSFWQSLPNPVKPFAYTTQPPPIILSICHESRTEGLEIYRLVFNDKLKHPLYFSPSLDTIYLTDGDVLAGFDECKWGSSTPMLDEKSVRTLVISIYDDTYADKLPAARYRETQIMLACTFENIEKLIILSSGPGREGHYGPSNFGNYQHRWIRGVEDAAALWMITRTVQATKMQQRIQNLDPNDRSVTQSSWMFDVSRIWNHDPNPASFYDACKEKGIARCKPPKILFMTYDQFRDQMQAGEIADVDNEIGEDGND
jgi:hypothetical protein